MSSRHHHDHDIEFAIFLIAVSDVFVGIPQDTVDDGDDPVLWKVGGLNVECLAYPRHVELVALEEKGHCIGECIKII